MEWDDPLTDGGCEILGFAVFVDDGALGDFTEVNQENDASVRNLPGLHELVITTPFESPDALGLEFRIKTLAYNVEGETYSDIASIVLADVPSAPLTLIEKV